MSIEAIVIPGYVFQAGEDKAPGADKLNKLGRPRVLIPPGAPGSYFLNGIRLWNSDQGKYFLVNVRGVPGEEVLVIEVDTVSTPPPPPIGELWHILVTGQSNAVGTDALPLLSSPAGAAKMFNGGVYPKNLTANLTSFVPLATALTSDVEGENMCYSLAEWLAAEYPSNPILISLTGAPSKRYDELNKGSSYYAQHVAQMQKAKLIAQGLGYTYRVLCVCAVHGESDQAFLKADYDENLAIWQADYETDAKAISGQTDPVPLFACQQASGYPDPANFAVSSALNLYLASTAQPSKIVIPTPRYMLDSPTNPHFVNWAHRWLGEYYAKAIKKTAIQNTVYKHLRPAFGLIVNNYIVIDFEVPVPPIKWNFTDVLYQPHYGFMYYDSTNSVSIVDVNITGPGQVTLTMSGVPTGSGKEVWYGCGSSDPYMAFPKFGLGRGNLTDSDATASRYGFHLNNFCLQFRLSL